MTGVAAESEGAATEWKTARYFATDAKPAAEGAGGSQRDSLAEGVGAESALSDFCEGGSVESFSAEISNSPYDYIGVAANSRYLAAQAAPEPTGALLTLVGLAGLALLRKRVQSV